MKEASVYKVGPPSPRQLRPSRPSWGGRRQNPFPRAKLGAPPPLLASPSRRLIALEFSSVRCMGPVVERSGIIPWQLTYKTSGPWEAFPRDPADRNQVSHFQPLQWRLVGNGGLSRERGWTLFALLQDTLFKFSKSFLIFLLKFQTLKHSVVNVLQLS